MNCFCSRFAARSLLLIVAFVSAYGVAAFHGVQTGPQTFFARSLTFCSKSTSTKWGPLPTFVHTRSVPRHRPQSKPAIIADGSSSGDQTAPDFWGERHIVLLCHNVSQDVGMGLFRPNNLLEGRVDVMCRCITNALYFSNGIRRSRPRPHRQSNHLFAPGKIPWVAAA